MSSIRWLLVAGAIAVVLSVLCGLAAVFGSGSRGLFSPDTLETKTQRVFLLPLTEFPLFRSRYEVQRYPLVEYLIGKGYWSPDGAATPRWFPTFHYNAQWYDGYSDFHRQFSWTATAQEWMDWSDENPEIASELWPRVLTVLRSGDEDSLGYASNLMWVARGSESVDGFYEAVRQDKQLAGILENTMP